MSQFDKYTRTEYVETLRKFLKISKAGFLQEQGFVTERSPGRKGRLPAYEESAIKALEEKVNEKAKLAESKSTTFGERYKLARDYLGVTDAEVARQLGVSREVVRRWGLDLHLPSKVEELAAVLNVPVLWLLHGGAEKLPANSALGVRVGEENLLWREELFGLTQTILSELEGDLPEGYIQAYIEWMVFSNPNLAQAARKAGGRWQVYNGSLLFAPWVPIPEHELTRRFWSDEVEDIIQEELMSKPSVYSAFKSIEKRCQEKGLQYPKKISLHKRVSSGRERAEKFGVDLNSIIAEAVRKYQN